MSLIPFILDLADELHEFSRCLSSGIDINDFGFGLYTASDAQHPQSGSHQSSQQQQQHQQQQQQSSPRRSRAMSFSSPFWMPLKRHHPYNRIKSACCGKSLGDEGASVTMVVSGGGSAAAAADKEVSPTGTPTKTATAAYSVVNKNGFQVSMNVKQFAPSELSVKTIDNCIVVEGRHDDKEDGHGVISRHFVRKYMLPKGYDPKDVLSTLSSDGILTVKAPPPPPPIARNDERNERFVEIQPTPGPSSAAPAAAPPAVMLAAAGGSAKESPQKEQAKKLLSPNARAECQLPEKRQKLEEPQKQEQPEQEQLQQREQQQKQQQEQRQAAGAQTPASKDLPLQAAATQPAPPASSVSVPEEAAKQQATPAMKNNKLAAQPPADCGDAEAPAPVAAATVEAAVAPAANDDTMESDKSAELEAKNQLLAKEAMAIDEPVKADNNEKLCVKEEKLAESNGDANDKANAESQAVESNGTSDEPINESCLESETKAESLDAETLKSTEIKQEDLTLKEQKPMEVDEEMPVVKEAAEKPMAVKGVEADEAKESAVEANETGNSNNNNNENSNSNSNSNSSSNDTAIVNDTSSKKPDENNCLPAGEETPADDEALALAGIKAAAAAAAAESVMAGDVVLETAVLPSETSLDIDDVALLKAAATADVAELTAAEENALLAEPMDGLASSDSPSAAAVDTVECSLFAKSHLGNGNGNSAALVAAEEVAN